MLLYGDVEHDARVRREAAALIGAGHEVIIAVLGSSPGEPARKLDGARIVPISPRRSGTRPGQKSPFMSGSRVPIIGTLARAVAGVRWLIGYVTTYLSWRREAVRSLPPADVWHGHDFVGLLAARSLRARHGGKLVYDSHELFGSTVTAARMPWPARKIVAAIEGRAARSADVVITVNDEIAAELDRRFHVKSAVVMNCPPLRPLDGEPGVMRTTLGLGDRPIVLHHGVLQLGRGIEQLIEATALLPPDVAVVIFGYGDRYEVAATAASTTLAGRMYVHPAIPVDELSSWVRDATIGVLPFQPATLNIMLSTPTKMFEYLERGVPMVVCDFPAIRRIVEEADAGIVCNTTSPAAIAGAIEELLNEPPARLAARRASARVAAESRYNWQAQAATLVGLYSSLGVAGAIVGVDGRGTA
jgi:glycosyltransferase involved in cell wall biosynthesis